MHVCGGSEALPLSHSAFTPLLPKKINLWSLPSLPTKKSIFPLSYLETRLTYANDDVEHDALNRCRPETTKSSVDPEWPERFSGQRTTSSDGVDISFQASFMAFCIRSAWPLNRDCHGTFLLLKTYSIFLLTVGSNIIGLSVLVTSSTEITRPQTLLSHNTDYVTLQD